MRVSKKAMDWRVLRRPFAVTYRRGAVFYADGYDNRDEAWSAFMRAGSLPDHRAVVFHTWKPSDRWNFGTVR